MSRKIEVKDADSLIIIFFVEKEYDFYDVVCDQVVYHVVCEFCSVPDAVEALGRIPFGGEGRVCHHCGGHCLGLPRYAFLSSLSY